MQPIRLWVQFFFMGAIFSFLLTGATPSSAFAADPAQSITTMEQQLFNHTYASDSVNARLDRIEQTVYGAPQSTLAVDQRIQNLGQFFQPAGAQATAIPGIGPKPLKGLPPAHQPPVNQTVEVSGEPDGSSYPVVTSMEQTVFHNSYEDDPLNNRLARLEKRVLGKAQDGTLQDRTDQLRFLIFGEANGVTNSTQTSQPPPQQPADPFDLNSSQAPASDNAEMAQALPKLESNVFHQTFSGDPTDTRLERLEMKLFNRTAPEMSHQDRVYRIASVISAKNSSRREQIFGGGPVGPMIGGRPSGGGSYSTTSSTAGTFGSMLLMILMSLL